MNTVREGIGWRINLAVGIGFVLVLVVGGISVLLAWTISSGVGEGRQRILEGEAVDRIHHSVHRFVADLQLILQGYRAAGSRPPAEVFEGLKGEIAAYEALERAQGGDEARQELVRLAELKSLLAELEALSVEAIGASARGRPPTPAELRGLNELAHVQISWVIQELHALHQKKFQLAIDRSQQRMLWISALYVAFALGGGLLLLLGNRFLSRALVMPITQLAQAALHIAGGDLSRRVPVRSGDEVGQLSRAFNLMAERLESHEADRLNFQAELERQVKERTQELEAITTRLRATQVQLIRSERIALMGEIAAGVTHEIRTPLNSLAINVQLLGRELSRKASSSSPREILTTLSTVEYEIARINRILEEFVRFARLPTPRFGQVEVVPLLQEIVGFLGPQTAESRVRVELSWPSSVAPVKGDRDQLREVFLNLGQNALQAMPNGGVLGVEVSQDGEWVEVAVTDCGPGIRETDRELIFLPFVSTKADGLGLGLAIVRRIVEDHGGSVSCQNRAGGGAVFAVRLPAAGPGKEG
ncbi:MAG: ATP-binding protein [Candidatus Methylomirabilia bacterium]